jgi:hypothetical protein
VNAREDLVAALLLVSLLVLAADWLARRCAEWVGVTLP